MPSPPPDRSGQRAPPSQRVIVVVPDNATIPGNAVPAHSAIATNERARPGPRNRCHTGQPAATAPCRCPGPSGACRGGSHRCSQHPGRLRCREQRLGVLDEGRMRGRPRHRAGPSDLDNTARRIPDCSTDRATQPTGRPPAGRDLIDGLGERGPHARRLPAAPPCLVPEHRDSRLPPPQPGQPTRHRRFWTCTTRSPNELDLLDTLHRHSGQPKKHRRTVTQARGLSRLLP